MKKTARGLKSMRSGKPRKAETRNKKSIKELEKPQVLPTYGLNMCTGHDWGEC